MITEKLKENEKRLIKENKLIKIQSVLYSSHDKKVKN